MNSVTFRKATLDDLGAIIAMLADDELGRARELVQTPPADCYVQAFNAIAADPNQNLIVAVENGAVVGTMMAVFLPERIDEGDTAVDMDASRVGPEAVERIDEALALLEAGLPL